MAEPKDSGELSSQIGSDSPGFTEFGLSVVPSVELEEYLDRFLTEDAKRRLGERAIRLNLIQTRLVRQNVGPSSDYSVGVEVGKYKKSISKYAGTDRQLRVLADGFEYLQKRDSLQAMTVLRFKLRLLEHDRVIVHPPFFDENSNQIVQAQLALPSLNVVTNADTVAQDMIGALSPSEHPSSRGTDLAHFAFFFTDLQVVERTSPARRLRSVPANE